MGVQVGALLEAPTMRAQVLCSAMQAGKQSAVIPLALPSGAGGGGAEGGTGGDFLVAGIQCTELGGRWLRVYWPEDDEW